MIKAATSDITKGWVYDAFLGFNQDEVQPYCVQDPEWQKCRLSMKNVPTHKKLEILLDWRIEHLTDDGFILRPTEVQIDNYLGALRRGAILDENNLIKRYI